VTAALTLKRKFDDGTPLLYLPPKNTLDPRYSRCRVHRVGCDCWEGHRNEDLQELRWELDQWRDTATEVLAGHPTIVDVHDGRGGHGVVACQCTGCQIARAAYWRQPLSDIGLWPKDGREFR